MSGLNGDKARFYRVSQTRALHRERNRLIRKNLAVAQSPAPQAIALGLHI